MDIYPESEPWQERLKIQKTHDEVMDKIGLNEKIIDTEADIIKSQDESDN